MDPRTFNTPSFPNLRAAQAEIARLDGQVAQDRQAATSTYAALNDMLRALGLEALDDALCLSPERAARVAATRVQAAFAKMETSSEKL